MTPEQPSDVAAAPGARPWLRPLVLLPVLAVLSLVGGAFPSFSVAANVYVLVLGGVLAWLGLRGRVPKVPSPRRLGRPALLWVLPVLAAALLELSDFLMGSTDPHPTVSGLMDPVLAGYPGRSAAYFLWLSAFWGLVRR